VDGNGSTRTGSESAVRKPTGTTTTASAAGKRNYAVFTIVEVEDKAYWRRVGNGYLNRDGSYNLYLEALPINGRLHMREVET